MDLTEHQGAPEPQSPWNSCSPAPPSAGLAPTRRSWGKMVGRRGEGEGEQGPHFGGRAPLASSSPNAGPGSDCLGQLLFLGVNRLNLTQAEAVLPSGTSVPWGARTSEPSNSKTRAEFPSLTSSLAVFLLYFPFHFSSSSYLLLFAFPPASSLPFCPFSCPTSISPVPLCCTPPTLACTVLTRRSLFSQIFQILFFQTGRLSLCRAHVSPSPQTVSFFS